jgi:TRAP-type C4-dicarboxylate transport system permease small subunit
MLVVSYYSIGIVKISMRNLSTGLRVPLGFIYIALPVAGVLMTLYFLLQIYHLINDNKQEEVEQNG